jgi:hypothetical protein
MKSFKDFVLEADDEFSKIMQANLNRGKLKPEVKSVTYKDTRRDDFKRKPGIYYYADRLGYVSHDADAYHHFVNTTTDDHKHATIHAVHSGPKAYNDQIKNTDEYKDLTKKGYTHVKTTVVPRPDSPPKDMYLDTLRKEKVE